jgi:hypothetical protein
MGWSGETSNNIWQKVDIELEQEDLIRVFREKDLPPDLVDRLPTRVCFQLLQNEAESLLLRKLEGLGYDRAASGARIATMTAQNNEIVGAIKQQLATV